MLERIAPESLQKVITKFYDVAGHVWVDLKLTSRTSYVTCFEVVYTGSGTHDCTRDKQTDTNS